MKVLYVIAMLFLMFGAAYAQEGCGLASRLQMGRAGQVTPGDANNVRDAAARSGVLLGQIEGGQAFGVLSEGTCAGGLTWVEVEFVENGTTIRGWTVEATGDSYFVDPLDGVFVSASTDDLAVSMIVPQDTAVDIELTVNEGNPVDEDNEFAYSPTSINVDFIVEREFDPAAPPPLPSITIYASDAFEDDHTMFGDAGNYVVEGLSEILDDQPDLTSIDVVNGEFPDLSPGVRMMLFAYGDYLDFANGSGVRYMTYYAQDFASPTNNNLLYRFGGFTSDEAYFIDAARGLDAPSLPPAFNRAAAVNDGNDGFTAFGEYAANNALFFNAIPPEQYMPNIAAVDAVIASLWIEGVEAE